MEISKRKIVRLDKELENARNRKKVDKNKQTKQESAEWEIAQSILGEIITNNFSKEGYERMSVTDLIWDNKKQEPRISWATWKRYYSENLDKKLAQLKDSTEYKDFDGVVRKIDGFKEEVGGQIKQTKNIEEEDKIEIELPGKGVLISEFAEILANRLEKEKKLFYRQDSREIVELGKMKNDNGEISHTGFISMKSGRFITLIEDYFSPWEYIFKKDGTKFPRPRSMTKDVSNTVLESNILEEGLPNINRIFTVQIPIIRNNKLTFPRVGYDERFNSWLEEDSPIISNMDMPLNEAKDILYNTLKEFCFETRSDYINAISALLTPFLRGIFKTGFNTRSPVYAYMANRERSGKDYLAGITGILYEGLALEEPPISNGEYRSSGGNDELRKKIISAMRSGKKRLHFSNNKGNLNNSVFESVTTATRFSDRLLGKNKEVSFDNEIDFSFSGNIGITLTPDLANRTMFINLFLDMEDANKRKFNNPNLHHWVLNNRNTILSALYSLIKNWFNNGCPDGSYPFASFPEWSRVCGGIMETAGYDNPCKKNVRETGISIDSETDEMKELFELCYLSRADTWMDKHDIKEIVQQSNIMSYIDWGNRSSQTKFGIKLNKFIGRILSDIRLTVENKKIRSTRWKYKFSKNSEVAIKNDIFTCKSDNLATYGDVVPVVSTQPLADITDSTPEVPNVTIGDHKYSPQETEVSKS